MDEYNSKVLGFCVQLYSNLDAGILCLCWDLLDDMQIAWMVYTFGMGANPYL